MSARKTEAPPLTTIAVPNLTSLDGLSIANDPALPTCEAQALVVQTSATNVEISGTDDSATCP